jgi:hypothetical protein
MNPISLYLGCTNSDSSYQPTRPSHLSLTISLAINNLKFYFPPYSTHASGLYYLPFVTFPPHTIISRSWSRIPVEARFSAPVQTGPGVHPASCTMVIGSFPEAESGRGLTVIPHPLLVPRSIKHTRSIPLPKGHCGL